MRNLFLLCLFLAAPFARAQSVEDAPLEDVPAIALPTRTATPRATPVKTPSPKPTAAKTPASQPVPAKTPATKPAPPKPIVRPMQSTPSPTPAAPLAPLPASPNAEDVAVEDNPLADEAPAPVAPPSVTANNAAGAANTVATPNAAKSVAPRVLTPHEKQYGHSHDAHHETARIGDGESVEVAPNWFDIRATFAADWMRRALVAGILAALLCGFLGVYVVLRRVVFVGVALAELSSAGIALGLLLGFAPILGALAFMAAGVVLFSLRFAPRRVPHESIIGVVYLLASALAVLFIAKSAQGETFMLKLLQGDVLLIDAATVRALAIAAAIIGVAHALFSKEFVLVSFDREAASTLGLRAAAWELFLMGTIGLAIAFSIHAVGVLLTSALLVLPAATALLLARSMKTAFAFSPLLAAVPVVLGLHISFVADYPASAVIVVLSFVLFLGALAARRGQ